MSANSGLVAMTTQTLRINTQFKPRDVLRGICLFVFSLIMHTYARGCTFTTRHLKETVLWGTITWSEMGKKTKNKNKQTNKKNIQAKKAYLGFWVTSHLPLA